MPNILVPCTNCLRSHYGDCYEAPKQFHECGGFNHIERYCSGKKRVTIPRGDLLPGTRRWCETLGLNDDPELKAKVGILWEGIPLKAGCFAVRDLSTNVS
jgi:hypothetical protein